MKKWTQFSIEYAGQRSYLDDLFQVYPTIPDGIRAIDKTVWAGVETAFTKKDNDLLSRELLRLAGVCWNRKEQFCFSFIKNTNYGKN
jgi:hypothetical protein